MPLMPERVKYRKMQRGSRSGLATRGNSVAFGEYGLQSLERAWMDTKEIEAARVAITRHMKRHGKMWIRIFPQKSSSSPPPSCSKWTGSRRSTPANASGWRRPSCRSGPGLFHGTNSANSSP
jgi:ribosomal protein L16